MNGTPYLTLADVQDMGFPCDLLLWWDSMTLAEIQATGGEKRLALSRGYKGTAALRSNGHIVAWGVVEETPNGLQFRVEHLATGDQSENTPEIPDGYKIV